MTKIGWSAVLNGQEVHSWNGKPFIFEYRNNDGGLVFRFKSSRLKSQIRGLDKNVYQIVERFRVHRPTKYHEKGTQSISFDGTKVTVDPNWTASLTLPQAKVARKNELRERAKEQLENTDWRVIQALELGNAIPAQVQMRRAAIRSRVVEMEAEIDALTTLEELDPT